MNDQDLEQIMIDGSKIAVRVAEVLELMYGPDYLTKDDSRQFTIEAGAVGYAMNQLASMMASLLIERMIQQGETLEEAHRLVSEGMKHDSGEMADLGKKRYVEGAALAKALFKKRSTSH